MDKTSPIRQRSDAERTAYIEGWRACLNVCKNKGTHIAELSLGVMNATNNLDVSPTTKEAPMESEDQVQDPEDETAEDQDNDETQDDDASDDSDDE